MTDFSAEHAVWTSKLKSSFGDAVELTDEQGRVSLYDIEAEFEVDGRGYAVLRRPGAGEHEILRITAAGDGMPELESIDDDDEWEDVSELYDELTFPSHDAE